MFQFHEELCSIILLCVNLSRFLLEYVFETKHIFCYEKFEVCISLQKNISLNINGE